MNEAAALENFQESLEFSNFNLMFGGTSLHSSFGFMNKFHEF